jgi:hypothetical protein
MVAGLHLYEYEWLLASSSSLGCFSPSLDLNHQSSRWSNHKVQLPARSGTWTWPYNEAPVKTKTWIGILLHLNYFSNFPWQTVHFQKHKRQVVIFSHVSMMWPFLHTTSAYYTNFNLGAMCDTGESRSFFKFKIQNWRFSAKPRIV